MTDTDPLLIWPDFVLELQALLCHSAPDVPLYLVGGCVRDACLREAITDVDIAVDGDALKIARLVANRLNAGLFIMDRDREVARVIIKRESRTILVDCARFRGRTLEDDLRDRDFTMNAMAVNLQGDIASLIDPLDGAADLRSKVLRLCAADAIAADPIRALRAVRQSAQFGLKIHPDALNAIRRQGVSLTETSPERIRDELYKLLALENAARALRISQHLGLLPQCIPGIDELIDQQLPAPHQVDAWTHTLKVVERMSKILTSISDRRTDNTAASFDLGMLVIQLDRFRSHLRQHIGRSYGSGRGHQELLLLGALLYKMAGINATSGRSSQKLADVELVARHLRLSGEEEKALIAMVKSYPAVTDREGWSDLDAHRYWHALGESGIDAILLAVADFLGSYGAELDQRNWLQIVEIVTMLLDAWFNRRESLVHPSLLLNGDDIMGLLNINSGPVVGALLTVLREAQVIGSVSSQAEARDFVTKQFETLQ